MKKRLLAFILPTVLLIASVMLAITTFAVSDTILSVILSAEKTEYEAGEDIDLTLTVKNIGEISAEETEVEIVLPKGLKLKEGDLNSEKFNLSPKDEKSFTLTALMEEGEEPSGTIPSIVSEPDESEDIPVPKTGDTFAIIFITLSVLTSAAVIVLILKNKKFKSLRMLSLIVCGILTVVVAASIITTANTRKSLTENLVIDVDGGSYTITATVTYAEGQSENLDNEFQDNWDLWLK